MLRIALMLALLSGCASDPKWLENRVTCTVDGTEMHFVSKWGPVEFGSQVADSDAKAVCDRGGKSTGEASKNSPAPARNSP